LIYLIYLLTIMFDVEYLRFFLFEFYNQRPIITFVQKSLKNFGNDNYHDVQGYMDQKIQEYGDLFQ